MNKSRELHEVEQRLKRLSKEHKPGKWKPESYIGSESKRFIFLNLKVPHIRHAQKLGYSFSNQPIAEVWTIWDYVWKNTKCFEAALSASHFVNSQPIEELYRRKRTLLGWQSIVDNWALSDEMSNAYSKLLEYKQKEFLPIFREWNLSKKPWEIRQSLVGLLFYARFRQKVLPSKTILQLIRRHLCHPHYYVQKAIGWTLRECWNVYPAETMKFLESNAALIPPGGWTAATERLAKSEKQKLILYRK